MAVIDENTLGIWFLQITPTSDWCGTLGKNADGQYQLDYRHRYYSPNSTDPFDGQDVKSRYSLTLSQDIEAPDKAIRFVEEVIGFVVKGADKMFGPGHEVQAVLRGKRSFDAFIDDLRSQPWAHARQVSPGDDPSVHDASSHGTAKPVMQ